MEEKKNNTSIIVAVIIAIVICLIVGFVCYRVGFSQGKKNYCVKDVANTVNNIVDKSKETFEDFSGKVNDFIEKFNEDDKEKIMDDLNDIKDSIIDNIDEEDIQKIIDKFSEYDINIEDIFN